MKKFKKLLLTAAVFAAISATSVSIAACGDPEPAAPAVPPLVCNLNIAAGTAADNGYKGEEHTLTYTATEGASAAVTVTKNGAAAEASDYAYDAKNKKITFNTTGAFVVTVTVTKDGLTDSETFSLSVKEKTETPPPEKEPLWLSLKSGMNNDYGKIEEPHTVSFPRGTLSVTKNGAPAAASDYVFDDGEKEIVFKTEGTYVLTVTDGEDSESFTVIVTPYAPPTVTLRFQGTDSDTITVTQSANLVSLACVSTFFDQGDEAGTSPEEYIVRRYDSKTNSYYLATEGKSDGDYSFNRGAFTPYNVGTYVLIAKVTTAKGAVGYSDPLSVTVVPDEITLSTTMTGEQTLKIGTPTELTYVIKDDQDTETGAENYEASWKYDSKVLEMSVDEETGKTKFTALKPDQGSKVVLTLTHKEDSSFTKSLTYTVNTADEGAPTLDYTGATYYFGSTPKELITSTGVMLYCEGVDYDKVTYEVVENKVPGTTAKVLYLNDDPALPYLLVDQPGSNTATGEVTVRMTVTKGGKSAAIRQKFPVINVGGTSNNDQDNAALQAYFEKHAPDSDMVMYMKSENGTQLNARQNMIIAKGGIVVNRTGTESWSGTYGLINVADQLFDGTAGYGFKVEFKLRVINADGDFQMRLGLRTGTHGQWGDCIDFVKDGTGKLAVVYKDGDYKNEVDAVDLPVCQSGTEVAVTVTQTKDATSGDVVWEVKFGETTVFKATENSGNDDKVENLIRALDTIQLDHGKAGSCMITDVTVTKLS